jgi:imidazolonepropionase-like amidohydrolase
MHGRYARFVPFIIFAATPSLPAARGDFKPPIAIVNARIYPAPGAVIPNGSIVIENGRISAVGPDPAIPFDARRLDAAGLCVYAGFIDCGTHVGITRDEPDQDERRRVEDESPDVLEGPRSATDQAYRRLIHPAWRSDALYDPDAAARDDHRAAGFTAAVVSPSAAILAGSGALIQLGDAPLRQSVLRPRLSQHAAFVTGRRPRDFPQPEQSIEYPTTTIGAISAFRQILLDAAWHRAWSAWSQIDAFGPRPPLDRDLQTLIDVLDQRRPFVFIANTESDIHRALNVAAEFNLPAIIAGGREAWKVTERLKRTNTPVILSLKWSEEPERVKPKKEKPEGGTPVPPDMRPLFDDEWERLPFEPDRVFEERRRLWHEQVDNIQRLNEADVLCGFGSFESQSPDEIITQLRRAMKRGLRWDVAVGGLTLMPAEFLGLSEHLGIIEPNFVANLTVFDRPFEDEKAKVRWVFVGGEHFDLSQPSADPKKRDGRGEGRSGRGRRGRERPAEPKAEERPEEPQAPEESDKPDDVPAPDDAELPPAPDYACEIEADRKPRVQTGGTVLLRNAHLLTITDGDKPDTDVLIENGRITAIGRGLTVSPPAPTFDLHGYCIMPGIIDCHSHMCSDGGLNEFALSVTPEVRVADVVDHRDLGAFRALAGGVTTIHTMHGSANTIGGQNAVLRLKYGRPADEWTDPAAPRTVKFALGENVKQSNARRAGTRFPNTRMGVEATMRRAFDAARQYDAEQEKYAADKSAGGNPQPIRRDLRLEALSAILGGDIRVHCHCYRADEVLRLFAVAEDYGFRIGVLQHILEGYRIIPEILRHGCGASTFSDWWAYKLEAFDAIPQNAARMTQGGIVTTVNSDSAELVRHLNLEAAKSLRHGGLSPNDCLRLITINGAIQLGIDKHTGSIETGKRADLAVFDGHPLDTFSRCVMTLIDGEVFFQHGDLDLESPAAPLAPRTFPAPREPLVIPPPVRGPFWIAGATVHPVSGPPIVDGLVVIADGTLQRVGPATDEPPPSDATVINAAGLHVYPGLINACSELGLTEIGSVGGSVDTADIGRLQPDLFALSAYHPQSALIEVARGGGMTSAMIAMGGDMLAGRTGFVHLDGWTMPEAATDAPSALVLTLPSLPVRFPDDMEKDKKQEAVDEHRSKLKKLEDFFRDARHYAALHGQLSGPPDMTRHYERKLHAMIPCVRGEAPIWFRANSYKQIREALRFAERYGLKCVLVGGQDAWKAAGELAERRIDVIIDGVMTYPRDEFEPFDGRYRNADILSRHGVRFAIADADASLAKNLGVQAGYAVAYGLNEVTALQAITLDAARVLGVDDRFGSLDVGKVADVIITTDTPLQAASRVVASFVRGRPVDLSSKHTRLDEKFRRRPAPMLPQETELNGPPPIRMPVSPARQR